MSTDLLSRIAHANDLVSVYEFIEHVADHSRPRKIHCPVHDDRTKSAQVYPDTNSLYCFTEGLSYDPVGLVAEQEGLSVYAACEYIEKYAGVRWERQAEEDSEFWKLIAKAAADPDDPAHWSARERVLYRWAIHRTVLDLVPAELIEWDEFDNVHLNAPALRAWRDAQLDSRMDNG